MIKRIKICKGLLSLTLVLSIFGICKIVKLLNDENYNKCNGLDTQINNTSQKSPDQSESEEMRGLWVSFVDLEINSSEDTQQKFENKKYDVVVANILADVIIPIAGIVDRFLKDGGIFISSGIIYMKEEAVKEAVENNRGLKLTDVVKQGDWRAVMAEKR